jgi:hypothetical protein
MHQRLLGKEQNDFIGTPATSNAGSFNQEYQQRMREMARPVRNGGHQIGECQRRGHGDFAEYGKMNAVAGNLAIMLPPLRSVSIMRTYFVQFVFCIPF